MPLALDGIRVVDLGGTVATGYCGKLFADYGAEVINLEPSAGFATRRLAPMLPGRAGSAMHAYLSTNKKSVVEDAGNAEGIAKLVESAHLVLDAGDEHPLSTRCKGIRTTISWYGEGPYAGFTGSDAQMFAHNGMLRNIGTAEGPPIIPTGYQAQIVGGLTACIPSLTMLMGREMGNVAAEPTHIEVSIQEAMLCFTEVGVVSGFNSGIEVFRMGINRYPPTYPLGIFPCKDGWLGITVLTPSQWRAFCELLDLNDLADVPLFQTTVGRLESLDVLEPMFCEKLLEHSAEDLFYRGQHARIPLARVPTMEELFQVDQLAARGAFAVANPGGDNSLKVPVVPFRLYGTPPNFGGDVMALGANTTELV